MDARFIDLFVGENAMLGTKGTALRYLREDSKRPKKDRKKHNPIEHKMDLPPSKQADNNIV